MLISTPVLNAPTSTKAALPESVADENTIEVTNPATGKPIAYVKCADASVVSAAVAAAKAALPGWAGLTVKRRAQIMLCEAGRTVMLMHHQAGMRPSHLPVDVAPTPVAAVPIAKAVEALLAASRALLQPQVHKPPARTAGCLREEVAHSRTAGLWNVGKPHHSTRFAR